MQYIKRHKKLFIILAILLVLLALLAFYILKGVRDAKANVARVQADITALKTAQNKKDYAGILNALEALQPDTKRFESDLSYFGPVKYIPYVNGYYNNAAYILQGTESVEAGAIKIVKGAEPIANSLGYGTNQVQGSAKIAAFLNGLPQLTPGIDNAIPDFQAAEDDFALVDPSFLPDITVKGINIKKSFTMYRDQFHAVVTFLPKVQQLVPVLQRALGDTTPTSYLLLFQNDKEIRATGGFISVYGFLNFNKGSLGDIKSNDIYNLDNLETLNVAAPVQLRQYNYSTRWYLRDSNVSPDVPTAAQQAEQFYKSVPGSHPIDGVIYIDTQFVSSLLDAVGPVYVPQYKQTVDSSNFAYELEYYSEKVDVNNPNRKQFVNLLLQQIKAKVFSAQKDSLMKLLNIGIQDFQQKHIAVYANNATVENAIEEYNWGGQFPQPGSNDFIGLVESNLGGAKDDFYLQRSMTNNIQKTSQGYLKTVTLTYTDNQLYDGWLNEPYKAWLRFYVPAGSKLVSFTGHDTRLGSENTVNGTLRVYTDLGYTVFDDHIVTSIKQAGETSPEQMTVTLQYLLPPAFNATNGYSLYVYKQSGMKDMQVTANDNGKKQSADILSDQVFQF